MSELQSVVFFKDKWNVTSARKWLKNNKIKALKPPDTTLYKNQIRFRIKPLVYRKLTTKKLNNRINLIIGWP